MKLRAILRFELLYQLRRPITWLFFIALLIFSYLNTDDPSVADALFEDFFINSPFAIAKTTVIGTFIWIIMAATIAGSAAARDIATNIYPLTYSTPITKTDYIGGRFLAAFILNAVMLLAIQAGIALAIYSPTVDPETVGSFGITPFIAAYAFISLPNAFFATAIQFWFASRSGRPTSSYLGSFILFFMGFFIGAILLYYQQLGTLVDPIGIRYIIEDLAYAWTPTERRDRLVLLEGNILNNRLVWLTIGIMALTLTYVQFRFSNHNQKERIGFWRRKRRSIEANKLKEATQSVEVAIIPAPTRSFNFATHVRQTIALSWRSFKSLFISRTGLAMLIIIPLLTMLVVINKVEAGGAPRIPTTSLVTSELTAPLADVLSPWSIIPFLILLIAGEIVWRERDSRMSDLIDVMPTSEWSLLISKFLAVALAIVALMALLIVGGVLTQMRLGYHHYDLQLYSKIIFGLQLPEYLLFATLVVIIHVIVNNKYIAHLVTILISSIIVMPKLFGIEHNLLVFNAGPQWSYTDMRGFGASLEPWTWFKLYWAAWVMLLAVAARLLWTRGKDPGIKTRLQATPARFTRSARLISALAGTLVVAIGGFIFYNTNFLNIYLTGAEYNAMLADYEKKYKRYEHIVQPTLVATTLYVGIFPDRGAAEIKGTYVMVNCSSEAIDSIHLATIPGATTSNVTLDRQFSTAATDNVLGHQIYALRDPLLPNDSLQLNFEVSIGRRGFANHGVYESVVGNGTFFTNRDWLPLIGYQSERELKGASDRREHRLPKRSLIASLYDKDATMIEREHTTLDVIMVTDENQVAVTSGALKRSWKDKGRRYFHYTTDGPVGNDFAFFSAKYDVTRFRFQGIDVSIYYHPAHKSILYQVTKSIRASIEHYSKNYGLYPHNHLTYAEVRGNEIGMHADESLIRFSEGTALWNPHAFDLPFSVVAHELAHQWWGHQLEAAYVEGAPVMSESLATFSSMAVVNENLGHQQFEQLLAFMRQPIPYAPTHHGEPLIRGIEPYLAYRKGPFALHALSEYIGADRVEGALKNLLLKHPEGKLPLSTTLDLYSELKNVTPDSLHYLLHELFEVNTLWKFRLERASAEQASDSTWNVALEVKSQKAAINGAGVEKEMPINEWVDIAVFSERNNPTYLKKHRIASEAQTIIINVKKKPLMAGIDPYHVLDWDEHEDDENIRKVRLKSLD